MLNDLTGDVRGALRMFARQPGTSSLIVFTLATAIGVATVGFTFADLVLLRGLPVDDPSRVVSIFGVDARGTATRSKISGPDFLDVRERTRMLDSVAVFRAGRVPLITGGQSRTLSVSFASADFFAAMGQSALHGRAFQPGDDVEGAPPVVLLSHRYWQDDFEARPDAIGRTLQLGKTFYTVVGVLRPDLEFGNLAEVDLWMPLSVSPTASRDARDLRIMARLHPGTSFAKAAAEVSAIGDALASEHAETNADWRLRLVSSREMIGGDGTWVAITLFLFSIVTLMGVATANVSNVVMVRVVSRQREIAVRTALGARSSRLFRQLVIEGLALSVAAAALAVPLAWLGLQVLTAASAEPVFRQLRVDGPELLLVALLALVCPVMFSVAPARALRRTDVQRVLASGGRGSTANMRSRGMLVVAQVALAVILLTASTLALRSTRALYSKPVGMATASLLTFTLDFNDGLYPVDADAESARRATLHALRSTAGVRGVAALNLMPVLGPDPMSAMTLRQTSQAPGEPHPVAVVTGATNEVASVLGLQMIAGRWWSEGESGVGVVSQETAVRYMGGVAAAVGQPVSTVTGSATTTFRVVGVTSDVAGTDFSIAAPPRIWIPLPGSERRITVVVSAAGEPANLSSAVRSVVAATAPVVPIETLSTMDDALRQASSSDFAVIGVLGGFAVVALILATTGLFGLVSFTVAERTAEFGTRMALGAQTLDVVRLVARQSLFLLGAGLAVGLAGGVGVGFAMRGMLYGLSPSDPVTMGSVTLVLALVTLVATALPAWRAARIDPIVAMRTD